METLLNILQKTASYFQKHGVESPKLDAELIIAHVLECNRMQLYLDFERPMDEETLSKIRPLIKRRASREPVQYILGTESFMEFELKVDRRALIPRPETEELIERIVSECDKDSISKIIDLGTGFGAIACALARHFMNASVIASDYSQDALSLAKENIQSLGLRERIELIHSSWFEKVDGSFDLIVSNPPYLSVSELENVAVELREHEPLSALSSGQTGLEAIQILLANAPIYLSENGVMYLEVGADQKTAIEDIVRKYPELTGEVLPDLNGRDRFVRVRRK